MVTALVSVSSFAFYAAHPLPPPARSSSRYRPPRRVPGSQIKALIGS